ncbi:hypothetical protein BDN70DRAFT_933921 [Pholiota conissans]|uniref:Uncharacterized protein n=1 Tax=Pholiota conissans TaxID=109636 RepID=A0A9P5YXZ1_9AGAR|nr:hypothetical protein BDN70DRAFT_933921 [Pholiota conissans]
MSYSTSPTMITEIDMPSSESKELSDIFELPVLASQYDAICNLTVVGKDENLFLTLTKWLSVLMELPNLRTLKLELCFRSPSSFERNDVTAYSVLLLHLESFSLHARANEAVTILQRIQYPGDCQLSLNIPIRCRDNELDALSDHLGRRYSARHGDTVSIAYEANHFVVKLGRYNMQSFKMIFTPLIIRLYHVGRLPTTVHHIAPLASLLYGARRFCITAKTLVLDQIGYAECLHCKGDDPTRIMCKSPFQESLRVFPSVETLVVPDFTQLVLDCLLPHVFLGIATEDSPDGALPHQDLPALLQVRFKSSQFPSLEALQQQISRARLVMRGEWIHTPV